MRRARGSLVSLSVAMLLASACSLGGCGGGAAASQPGEALRAYARALDEQRVEDAYRMLSEEARRGLSLEAFRRAVVESPGEAKEIAQALARPSGDARVTARVVLPTGEEVPLVLEDGVWKVEGSAIDLYGHATPRQALLGFLRAFKRKRWDVVLRYVPDEERAGGPPTASARSADAAGPASPPSAAQPAAGEPTGALTASALQAAWEGAQREEMEKIVQALEAALPEAQIEETGDTAAMAYGAGGTVSFVRERGAWKILDF